MSRWITLAAAVLVGAVVLLLVLDDSGDRSGRERSSSYEGNRVAGDLADADAGPWSATAARLSELIREHGGFATRGRVVLTRPAAAGRGLRIVMRGDVAGTTVEVAATSDENGMFRLPQLPRAGEFTLTVEGERVQPFQRRGLRAPEGEVLDVGELRILRYYFMTGTVLGEGRTGISGAEVALLEPTGGSGFSFLRSSQRSDQDEPILARTQTGPDGRFALRLRTPGILSVRARAGGWATHMRSDVVIGGAADVDLMLPLTRGHEVVGYVLDAAGRPIAEAAVTILVARMGWSWGREIAHTDGTGRFEFRVEPNAQEYTATAVAGDRINLSRRFRVPLQADLILKVPGDGVLTGVVLDAKTQQPVAGADVLIGLMKGAAGGMRTPDYSKALLTDAYGRYRVTGIGEGRFQSLSVRARGYADMRATGWMPTDAEFWQTLSAIRVTGEKETALPAIELQRGRTLTGRIYDKAAGEALAGATVELWDFIMGSRATTTDANGSYRFDGIGDRIAMVVVKDGYGTHRDSPFPGFQVEGEAPNRDIALDPGGVVRGTVKTTDGTPVARALVRLQSAARGWQAWTIRLSLRDLWTYTDDKGEYGFTGVPPVKLYAEAQAAGFDASKSKEQQVKAAETVKKLDVALLRAASMAGRVVDRAGEPVAGARLTVARDPGESNTNRGAEWQALGAGKTAFSDTRGRFAVEGVPVGQLLVRVEAPGFAVTTKRYPAAKPGEKIAGVKLELSPAFSITGRVIGREGVAIGWTWVRATHTASPDGEPTRQLLGARVESDGSFLLRNVPAGTYTIEVRVSNVTPGQTRYENLTQSGVAAGSKDLELQLKVAAN